jgi:hypothetical protein
VAASVKPSVVILGFALGSAASITFALLGVAVVFAVLGGEHPRLEAEFPTLLSSLAAFVALTAVAGASFYGQLRERPWRRVAVGGLIAGVALIGWMFWPA